MSARDNWLRRLWGKLVPRAGNARRVTAAELERALQGEHPPVLVDIRSREAFAAGHLPGAVNVPKGELARAAERLSRGAPTVVY